MPRAKTNHTASVFDHSPFNAVNIERFPVGCERCESLFPAKLLPKGRVVTDLCVVIPAQVVQFGQRLIQAFGKQLR